MHYVGMSAFRVSGRMEWDATFVAVSVVLGMILSSLALNRAARPISPYSKYIAAVILTLGICSLHFTGMAAVTIIPDDNFFVPASGISSNILALCIASASLLIVSTGFYVVCRRPALARGSRAAYPPFGLSRFADRIAEPRFVQ